MVKKIAKIFEESTGGRGKKSNGKKLHRPEEKKTDENNLKKSGKDRGGNKKGLAAKDRSAVPTFKLLK